MLTTAKAWELRDRDIVVIKGAHYTLIDDPKVGPPGWTTLRTTDRNGLLTAHMIEGTDDVNVVRVKDFRPQIERAKRLDNRRRNR